MGVVPTTRALVPAIFLFENNDLYIYDLEKEKATKISNKLRAINPVWSPDGKDIAFVRNFDGQNWLAKPTTCRPKFRCQWSRLSIGSCKSWVHQ